jgi:hypothetical protein
MIFIELSDLIVKMHFLSEELKNKQNEKEAEKVIDEIIRTVLNTLITVYRKLIILDRSIIEGIGLDFNYEKALDFDYKKVDDVLNYLEKLIKNNKDLSPLFDNYKFIEEAPDDIRDTLICIYLSFKLFYLQFRKYLEMFSEKFEMMFEQHKKDKRHKNQENIKKRSRKNFRKYKEILPN